MTTQGLWHYPASITNASIAVEVAQFAPTTGFTTNSTAVVINTYKLHLPNYNTYTSQMVFFLGVATDWAPTSNFLQHAWIHWATRGLCMYYLETS
jgi:hypothetical protein